MKNIGKLGFWAALAAGAATVGFDVVQVLQLLGLTAFPLDAVLIYGFSLAIPIPWIIALLALHYTTPEEKRFWSHGALVFSAIYASYVILNYVVQLATVLPASVKGALDPVRVLDQTPHSLFWDVDALGYIFLGLATLFAAPVFGGRGEGKWARRFFLANALVTPVIAFVYFYPDFSEGLLLWGLPWAVTAPGAMLALAAYFRAREADGRS